MNVHSVSAELATVARKTRGAVPPKLVVSAFPGLIPVLSTDCRLGRVHDRRWGQDVSLCERLRPGPLVIPFDTHTNTGWSSRCRAAHALRPLRVRPPDVHLG